MMRVFLELNSLNFLLSLLLVDVSFDSVVYGRALTCVYSVPDTLAYIYSQTSTNKNLPKGRYNLKIRKLYHFTGVSWCLRICNLVGVKVPNSS